MNGDRVEDRRLVPLASDAGAELAAALGGVGVGPSAPACGGGTGRGSG